MKTLLLISTERAAGAFDELHTITGLRVIPRASVNDGASAIAAGVFDLALLVCGAWTDAASLEVQRLRGLAPRLPVLAATGTSRSIEAYASGADAVLPWPGSAGLLPQIIQRWLGHTAPLAAPANLPNGNGRGPSLVPWPSPAATPSGQSALEVLREFSKILSHSLDERSFAQRLVEQLAEILGVVRIALFLEPEVQTEPVAAVVRSDPRLACVASVGVPADVTACLDLSRDGGLGRSMTHRRGVLSKYSPHLQLEMQGDLRILQEFEVLGCDMALPIRDRDKVLGVAVLGERITGQPFTTEELNLAYFLMGELGMAIRNSRLHRMLTVHHELLSRILESITSGSLVVGGDLRVLHANRAANGLLGVDVSRMPSASDLPAPVLQQLHAVATQGASADPLFVERPAGPLQLLRFTLVPLQGSDTAGDSRPVIVLIEDWTKIHASKQAEIQTANSQLISTIAARFAHEIRNSLVPLSTHAQLFEHQVTNADFLTSLRASLNRETLRIRRLSDQMLFLARPDVVTDDTAPIGELLDQALVAAQEITGRTGNLVCTGETSLRVRGTRESLVYALQEILANSLQSVAGNATIRLKLDCHRENGSCVVIVEVADSGTGFTSETASRATEPFFTTRTTGVGLGLAVARKIVEEHGGQLTIFQRTLPEHPDLRLILPAP